MAEVSQGVDAEGYFASQGWDAVKIDGHDHAAVAKAVADAKANDNGKPKVIIAKYQFIRKWSEIKEFIGDVGL